MLGLDGRSGRVWTPHRSAPTAGCCVKGSRGAEPERCRFQESPARMHRTRPCPFPSAPSTAVFSFHRPRLPDTFPRPPPGARPLLSPNPPPPAPAAAPAAPVPPSPARHRSHPARRRPQKPVRPINPRSAPSPRRLPGGPKDGTARSPGGR